MNPNSTFLAPILLAALVVITLIAAAIASTHRRRLRAELRSLAGQWRMTYARNDRLRIAERIQQRLPVPGAAALTVQDVIYGTQGSLHRAVFTFEFTIGVVGANKRSRRVGILVESRDPRDTTRKFEMAPDGIPLLDQYRALDPHAAQKEGSAPSDAEPVQN